jgi:hypothetical protein
MIATGATRLGAPGENRTTVFRNTVSRAKAFHVMVFRNTVSRAKAFCIVAFDAGSMR